MPHHGLRQWSALIGETGAGDVWSGSVKINAHMGSSDCGGGAANTIVDIIRAVCDTPYTLHLAPDTLPPAPCTLHPTPYTLHPTP